VAELVQGEPRLRMLTAHPYGDALEVWGDPIEHSRSPELHAAAYSELGMPWSYGRRQVTLDEFARQLASLDPSFRGLSLTYPLKGAAFAASVQRDRHSELTGAVNTLLVGVEDGPLGFNTDVGGLVRDLREHGVGDLSRARIVGAGATATSALVALAELGARHIDAVARRAEAVVPLRELGTRLGVQVGATPLDAPTHAAAELTITTLPGGAAVAEEAADTLAATGGLLYDVVYGHWPTALAAAWERAGHPAVNGLGMLLHQAVLQVRLFATGNAEAPLPGEERILAAMRAAVM